ncbi:39S ribosomal protein L3, mitochondrial-like [Penaeus japonicus]|uniref:39S ribosomal protein L3, mitochondrial-like n=1 Tax=Penaeus japonicus TaxID=27405 RepID=UPI001C712622|nr:39S ribosomal protein L3, mitochondrial-like [Penaeus japonicus]
MAAAGLRSPSSMNNLVNLCQKLTISGVCKNVMRSQPTITQVRCMSRVKKRHTVPPFWHPKITRTLYPEGVTPENQAFVSEVISEKFSSPLRAEPWERGQWTKNSIRCGLIARKIGIYPMWTKDGTRLLTTLLQASDNHVINYIPPEDLAEKSFRPLKSSKLGALVVGTQSADPREITKEYFNMFSEVGIAPKKKLTKFLVTPNAKLAPGTPLYASHFQPGAYVDVAGTTIDRGYQGVMKRWGFKGMPASHGVTKSHRRGGSIGSGREKSRVWPGQKMPGHMGRHRRVIRGLKIWRINTHYNVLWVSGPAVPGPTGAYVYLYDSILPAHRLRQEQTPPPFPTLFQDEVDIEEELFDEDLHVFSQPSISFAEK